MKTKKRLIVIVIIAIIAIAGCYFLTQRSKGAYSQFEHITTKNIFTRNVNNPDNTYYVYFYNNDCQECHQIEDLICDFAKENDVYFINTENKDPDNKISKFDWSAFKTENDIEIGQVDKNNNIQYYEGENAQKYKNSTELNRFNKIKKYEIKIVDKNYLKINKKAKKGYVYASLLTPEIDYSSLQIYSSVELANLPTLLEIKSYHVENYYYDVEDIKQYITNLN